MKHLRKLRVFWVAIAFLACAATLLVAGPIYDWEPIKGKAKGSLEFIDSIHVNDSANPLDLQTFSFSESILPDWNLSDLGKAKVNPFEVLDPELTAQNDGTVMNFFRSSVSGEPALTFDYNSKKGFWTWYSEPTVKSKELEPDEGVGKWVLRSTPVPAPSALVLVLVGITAGRAAIRRRHGSQA